MKLKKLRVRNVQSAKDVTINFGENGVFHLVGPNNIGKSVLVKSIQALFLNVSNNRYKEYLRDDCETFIVEGEMWSGDKLKLSRGATDYYEWTINGVEGRMDKTGGKVPKAVEDSVNMYVDKEKTNQCLNIRLPRSVLLFVDMTAGDTAYIMQKSLGTEEFLHSMKLSEKKRKSTAKEITTVEEYKERENVKLTALETTLSKEKTKLEKVMAYEAVLNEEYALYEAIEDIARTAKNMQKTKNELTEKKKNLKEVDGAEAKKLIDELTEIEELRTTMIAMVKIKNSMKDLKSKVTEKGIQELKNSIEEFRLVDEMLKSAIQLQRINKQKKMAKEEYENSDKELTDFMRDNKFCPIVAKTINKQCPFGEVNLA